MRDAARALDDVSDHLGEVLRRADQLLAEWSEFGAQVRSQVEREAAAIGTAVEGAVARAASTGLDHAIADRLRALTTELERLEQRTRAASRAVVERRDGDRRMLWVVVAGVVIANALLVVSLLRGPVAPPVVEPVRIESSAPPAAAPPATAATGAAELSAPATGSAAAGSASQPADATAAGSAGSGTGLAAGSAAPGAGAMGAMGATKPGGAKSPEPAAAPRPASQIALPPKAGAQRFHKKP